MAIGELELVSLQALRERVKSGRGLSGRLKVSAVTGDVRHMHRFPENARALFQVASQFNLLEMTGPEVTPENGVTIYEHDHTQGPACAIAAGAATIYRNYFAPVGGSNGQTNYRQLDGLAELGGVLSGTLKRPVEALWQMRNGYALCTEEDHQEAVKWFRSAADQGNALAQINLGSMYAKGRGVAQDHKEAVKWYRLAADQGNAVAQNHVGTMYDGGRGVAQDYKEAMKWFRLAAERGNALAQFNLGKMYRQGHGVAQDYKEAMKWFRLAADQGNAVAQNHLGTMYDSGRGVAKNYKEAVKWYRLAAKGGNASAQGNLGIMYVQGRGVAQDFVRAHMWSNLAAAQGLANPDKVRNFLLKQMTAKQIEEAQELAQKCTASNYKQCGDATQVAGGASSPPSSRNSQKSEGRSGTGFFVSNDGYLITNEHVVKSCEKLQTLDDTGQQFPARIVRVSESDDLALLKVDTKRNSVAVFRESAKINQGEAVYMYGFPLAGLLASSGSVSTGVVTALAGIADDSRQM